NSELAGDGAGAAQILQQRRAYLRLDLQHMGRPGEGQCRHGHLRARRGKTCASVAMACASARVMKVRAPVFSVCGKSLRQWPPRDSCRASAAAVTSLAAAVMLSKAGSLLVVSSRVMTSS